MNTTRPDHLPDFGQPPLNEVVLGVQFSPAKGYQQILAGDVWALFRSDYPFVQEHPALESTFETFGLPQARQVGGRLSVVTGALHDRFWFLKNEGEELIQFQRDRLLHNWRKVGDQTNEYPRFETMIERYTAELKQLEKYFDSLSPQSLSINQCEVSYINHIETGSEPLNFAKWLQGFSFEGIKADDASIGLREVIRGEDDKPIGRLTYEINIGITNDGKRIIILNLTARGAPAASDIESALRFILKGRELIVTRFAQITTRQAHKLWDRLK